MEIGVRRSIGATRKEIRYQFLLESIVLSGIGGLVGVFLGTGITLGYTNYTNIVFSIPVSQVLGAILLALLIGAISGVYPAIKASKIQPADELENEKYNLGYDRSANFSVHDWWEKTAFTAAEKQFLEGNKNSAKKLLKEYLETYSQGVYGNPAAYYLAEIYFEKEEFEEAFPFYESLVEQELSEQFDLDPEVEAALVDASLEFSQCMRDEGIDFPDPKPGEFGFFAFRDANIDFESEKVQEAFEICQPENPLENLDD